VKNCGEDLAGAGDFGQFKENEILCKACEIPERDLGFSRAASSGVTSNTQDRPACNIICVAVHNELPAGHILSPMTRRGRGSPRGAPVNFAPVNFAFNLTLIRIGSIGRRERQSEPALFANLAVS